MPDDASTNPLSSLADEMLNNLWSMLGTIFPMWQDNHAALAVAAVVVLFAVPIAVIYGGDKLVCALLRRKERRLDREEAEKRAAAKASFEDVPESLIRAISAEVGFREARVELLSRITAEWKVMDYVLADLLDSDVVASTRNKALGTWSEYRQREFCLRYRDPLAVVLSPAAWAELFLTSNGYHLSNRIPTVCGIGESNRGMYVVVSTAADWTQEEWDDILGVLAAGLDAPEVAVELEGVNSAIIHLNDARLRPPSVPKVVGNTDTPSSGSDDSAEDEDSPAESTDGQ